MTAEKLLPTMMIAMSTVAGIVYGSSGDWRRCVYWLAAATLNFAVTY